MRAAKSGVKGRELTRTVPGVPAAVHDDKPFSPAEAEAIRQKMDAEESDESYEASAALLETRK